MRRNPVARDDAYAKVKAFLRVELGQPALTDNGVPAVTAAPTDAQVRGTDLLRCALRRSGGDDGRTATMAIRPSCPISGQTMDLGLSGKIVVVTGASKGIGYGCAAAFAGEGARVVLVSRSAANLDAAMAKLPPAARDAARAIVADLVDAAEAERMIDEAERDVGPIDILVNSAGAARRYAPAELDAAAWHAAMDAKYFSYIHPIDAALRRMAARGRGAIVNIIGSGGKVANPVHLPGGAANAALMLATAGLAAAFAPKGIRINGINPGATLTGRVEEGLGAEARMTGLSVADIAGAHAGEDPARPAGDARGGRARRAVPGVGPGELRHRSDRADGRRSESGHLETNQRADCSPVRRGAISAHTAPFPSGEFTMPTDIDIAQQARLLPIARDRRAARDSRTRR